MPKLLDVKDFIVNPVELKEVSSTKIYAKNKFHSEGLFSEQIFGPVKNYTCQCGMFHGASKDGSKCNICKVDITNSNVRRSRYAKITLPIKVVNPIFYDLLVTCGGTSIKQLIDSLMKEESSAIYIHEDEFIVSSEPAPEGVRTYERHEGIQFLVEHLAENLSASGIVEWQLIKENLDKLFLEEIIVLPADLRPASKKSDRGSQVADKVNRYYVQILTKSEIMRGTLLDIQRDKTLFYQYFNQIQRYVNDLYNHVLVKMSKKEGLIRGNILGKRLDFSGRAVIIPDPLLKINQCCLPYLMILELYKLQISRKLIELGHFRMLNEAVKFVDDCIEISSPTLFEIAQELVIGEVCLLNRQPSLHRLSMLGFDITISLDKVIKIHPLACSGFNADFDGDQMAVYIPISDAAKEEIKEKMMITKNFINPSDGGLSATPSQDIILGIYALTANKFPRFDEESEYKGCVMTKGRQLFNNCLPKDYPPINEEIRKSNLMKILNDINNSYSDDVMSTVLDNIKLTGFKWSTFYGCTISLDQCVVPDRKEFRDKLYEHEDIHDQLNAVNSDETIAHLKEHFQLSYLIESGARGSWDQARQIILTRGFISNFKLEILETPIKHSFLEGLTKEEFFTSTYGSRKGLLDVALNTGTSGYLSRKLMFACVNLEVGEEEDCGTPDTLELHIKNLKMAERMVERNIIVNGVITKITRHNFQDYAGQLVNVRSPIFCKNPRICKTCYGDFWEKLHSKYIGVIAAQSLGECNTQLILRTFHTSGVAVSKSDSMSQDDIVGDLSTASKCLHGNKNRNYKDILYDLYRVYNSNRRINHIHFECVVSQLMWKGYKKWRLLENRDQVVPEYLSVQTVPSYESWLLGLAFSRPRQHILRGIFESGKYKGIMDKLLIGESLI